jgi:hypothetical protein
VLEYHGARARLAALLLRDGDAVLAHSELAIAAARRAHVPATVMAFARQLLPTGYVLRGEFALAIAEAEATAKDAFPWSADTHRMVAEMIRAYQALVERREDRDAALKRALGKARELDRTFFFQSLHREASLLCAAAMEAGIEVEFVTRAIRQRKLKPPSLSIAAWPWPVRIHGFGALAIEHDGVLIAFSGKAQKKPLELVKALVAAGGRPTSLNDDVAGSPGTLQFSAPAYSVGEGAGSAVITVTRVGGSSGAVSVTAATVGGGTATAGADYTVTSVSLNWPDGDASSKTLVVPIIDDALVEPSETVNLALSAPTGGAVLGAQATAILTIIDNDAPPPPAPQVIPTLSWTGLLLLTGLLALAAIVRIRLSHAPRSQTRAGGELPGIALLQITCRQNRDRG